VALQLAVLTALTVAAVALAVSQAPVAPSPAALYPSFLSSTTSTTPSTLTVGPMPYSDAPIAPTYCSVSYPSRSWPPRHIAVIAVHVLTVADVPAGMTRYPPTYASNGPNLDQLAVGFPRSAMGEVDYAGRVDPARTSFISEILGHAPSRAGAIAAYRYARDHIYGDCERYYEHGQSSPRIQLSQSGPDLFAFKTYGGDSRESIASFTVIGIRADFVFDISVGDHTFYPSQQQAVFPTISQVSAVVDAALSHLPK